MSDVQRREFHEALLDADTFQDLPGKSRRRYSRRPSRFPPGARAAEDRRDCL
jgi:hypothetical protein